MNFEELKNKINQAPSEGFKLPEKLSELKATAPITEKIKKTMRTEILSQLVFFLIFFGVPSIQKMNTMSAYMYYMVCFITASITAIYLWKMQRFLSNHPTTTQPSMLVLKAYVKELQLTLQTYTTAVIASSMLLPLLLWLLYLGKKFPTSQALVNYIESNFNSLNLTLFLLAYLIIGIGIIYITQWWCRNCYQKHLDKLEATLDKLASDF